MFYFSHSTKPYVNCTTYCIHICYSIPPPNISMQQRLHARSKRDSKVSIFNHFETIGDIEKTSSSRLNPFFYSILYCTFVKITNPFTAAVITEFPPPPIQCLPNTVMITQGGGADEKEKHGIVVYKYGYKSLRFQFNISYISIL